MPAQSAVNQGQPVAGKQMDPNSSPFRTPANSEIKWVWAHNLEQEIERIRDIAETYQHVAMDAQFPGIVARPTGPFSDYADYNYQMLKCNVDLTRVLQIGMTFSDDMGNRPEGGSTWRFNFGFNECRDLIAQDSPEARGLDLSKHQTQGIDPQVFAELLMSSGLVLNEDVRWITFSGASGFAQRPPESQGPGRPGEPPWVTFSGVYDFGHLLQLLTSQPLPNEVLGFQESLDLFFPSRCDVSKHVHRLPQLNGHDSQKRAPWRNANHLLEAFFHLPDSVRRTAFDKQEPITVVEEPPRHQRKQCAQDEERRHKGKSGSSEKRRPATAAVA